MADSSEFDCPVCWENLLPPVFQCYNGHLLCSKCIPSLPKCPICRDDMPEKQVRNREIEKVILALPTTCQFKQYGCESETKHDPMDCVHAVHNFCSYLDLNCHKFISREKLLLHIMESHEATGDLTDITDVAIDQFGVTMEQLINGGVEWKPVFFVSQNNIFFLRTTLSSAHIYWNVSVLGSKEAASKFGAKIKLLPILGSSKDKYYKWVGPVNQLKRRLHGDSSNEIFSISTRQIKSFWTVGDKGGWKLHIRIYKKQDGNETPEKQMLVINNVAKGKEFTLTDTFAAGIRSNGGLQQQTTSDRSYLQVWPLASPVVQPATSASFVPEPGNNANSIPNQVHLSENRNVICDSCEMNPIVGNHYKCIQCSNFNLCSLCVQRGRARTHAHLFLMITSDILKPKMATIFRALNNLSIMTSPMRKNIVSNFHVGIRCDGCHTDPIVGARHKCVYCDDYNLCDRCLSNPKFHKHGIYLVSVSDLMKNRMMSAFAAIRGLNI